MDEDDIKDVIKNEKKSISEIFVISFVVLLVALGVTIFIKEIPLDEGRRKINRGVSTDE